jgi:hypothetical protein
VIAASDSHSEKQLEQSFSTEEGMQMDESDEHFENADSSIQESWEPDSNATCERAVHPEKQDGVIRWMEEGMQSAMRISIRGMSLETIS